MREETSEGLNGEVRRIKLKRRGLVYCEDCKYWAEFTFTQPPQNYCGRLIQADYNNHNFGFEMDADDFCSRGEKR